MTAATGYAAEIAESARDILGREAPLDGLLERLQTEAVSQGAWDAAAEVGWFRLLTSEARGGLEAGPAELVALFREIGRHLPAGPYVESVVAAGLLRSHADLGPDTHLIAYAEPARALLSGGGVTADAGLVDFGGLAAGVVLRLDAEGPAIAYADLSGNGVAATDVRTFDLAGRPARLQLEGAPVEVVLAGEAAAEALDRIDALSRVARAATLAGAAAAVLDMSVAYARERVQFDRPIGSFQAVQHRLAEMAVTLAAADAAVDALAGLAGSGGPKAEQGALYAYAAEQARALVLSGLQVHGGIGFTAEHPLHAYLKRVLRLQAMADADSPIVALGQQLLARS